MSRLHIGEAGTVEGLESFNDFVREQGLHRELARRFGHLKTSRVVVYPRGVQMQVLLDMSAGSVAASGGSEDSAASRARRR